MARSDEAMRYRRAAEEALQQLDWCIGYLHGIRKAQLSTRLAKNREFIKRNLLRESTAPTPTATTSESEANAPEGAFREGRDQPRGGEVPARRRNGVAAGRFLRRVPAA